MPTAREECANYAINQQMCPCTYTECRNHGICCECLLSHRASRSLAACMRGAKRNPATVELHRLAVACATNYARNREECVCTSETCERRGICCSCVRNHFNVAGTGRVACMRALA
ncbi:MAG: hypothetical protein QHJ73_10385 [Armatimonadota bacterium]|nr:hypothetical protein [Armatimonadota bacterium]